MHSASRTVVVTGANRGIGFAVAKRLVQEGCRVVMLARDRSSGERAERELASQGDVRLVIGDLSSPRTTRIAASRLLESCPRFDVLVHNAGLWPHRCERDENGIERAFAVNHLAPFLLNHLLRHALPRGGRIVHVSAGLYVKGKVDLERTPYGHDFHAIRTYATTKLFNLLVLERFSRELAVQGVTINAVHPGVIRTGLGDRTGLLGLVLRGVKHLWKEADEGARPIVRLALDPASANVTGKYFHLDAETPLADVARDRTLADRVWDQAATLSGIAGEAHDGSGHGSEDASAPS